MEGMNDEQKAAYEEAAKKRALEDRSVWPGDSSKFIPGEVLKPGSEVVRPNQTGEFSTKESKPMASYSEQKGDKMAGRQPIPDLSGESDE